MAILVFGLVVGIVFVPPVRTVALTASLVPELVSLPVRPLSALAPAPNRITTTYGEPADRLDVYIPRDAARDRTTPAVVLALGVHPEAIDDPNIAGIAAAMARCGVVVGLPDSTALRELRVTPAEPAHLVDAALAVAALPEVDGNRVGLAGFSAGASMALIAAADPRLAGRVSFVSDFGGYSDAETLVVDVATRTMSLDGATREWSPDPGIRHDVAVLLARAIEPVDPALEALLASIAALDSRPTVPDPIGESTLTGDARAAYLLFSAPDRPAAEAIVESFSPTLRADLRGISPDAFAQRIDGPVFILHGAGDSAIPVSHAYSLRAVLASELVAKVTIFGRFEHGQPGREGLTLDDAADIWELTLYLHDVVAAATE